MPFNLFIDTNALLNFYHFSGEDLEELTKLTALIGQGDIILWLPQQVCDEFARNRDAKIKDAMAGSTKSFSVTAPAFFRNYTEYAELRKAMKQADTAHSKLLALVKSDIAKEELAADHTIKSLFDKGRKIARSSSIFRKAIERFRVGNPPGKKKDTMGDEINWDSLLDALPKDEDLHIVSVDGDYSSVLATSSPNSFLSQEFKSVKGGDLYLYSGLQPFFSKHFAQIKLATDIAKVKAINSLATSQSFSSTHVAVAALQAFKADFTAQDISEMVGIAESNSQVGWIMGDDDVSEFYQSLLTSKQIDDALKKRITELLPRAQADDVDEDLPF